MNRLLFFGIVLGLLFLLSFLAGSAQSAPPTLDDFWDGHAEWVLTNPDIGLPMGESDTVQITETGYRSYLHASNQSAGVIDQCGNPVEFPGCVTLWESEDGGDNFSLEIPVCLLPCGSCPCTDEDDHITAQQYPRVAIAEDGTWYMAYEWHAQTILRRSEDGLHWPVEWEYLLPIGGVWPRSFAPCDEIEDIGEHPNIRGEGDVCLVGAPPGLFIEGDTLYIFVTAGSAPAHLRCYKGNRFGDLGELQRCDTDPLFSGAKTYGDIDAIGLAAAPHFDFRYISSADVIQVGEYYYMAYEGIRGPSELEYGRDNQFGLGFARTTSIDSAWEVYTGNPALVGLVDNWGIGHADLLIEEGVTVMITATSRTTRGRYALEWR